MQICILLYNDDITTCIVKLECFSSVLLVLINHAYLNQLQYIDLLKTENSMNTQRVIIPFAAAINH